MTVNEDEIVTLILVTSVRL